MRLLTIGMTALSLAACSAPGDNAAEAPANDGNAALDAASDAGNAVDTGAAIANLTDLQRQGVMLGAIRDANLPCRDVTEVVQVEPTDGKPTWRAKCEEGDFHLVIVAPDGNAQVVSRTGR